LNAERRLGLRVVGLVRHLGRARERFASYAGRDDLQLVEHDAGTPWRPAGPVDWVVHAASPASPKHYLTDPVGTITPNVAGTDHLLALAHWANAKGFLLFSSGEVYGPTPARVPTGEDGYGPVDPLDVRSPYAEGKRAAEALCAAWHRQHGVPAVIVRPFHTYGPGMRLDDGRVFADFVRDVVARRNLRLASAGTATRSFTYLADATLGYWTVLLKGQPGTAYNVADDGGELSVRALAELLVSLYPERNLRVEFGGETAAGAAVSKLQRSCPDVTRLRSLGWSPAVSVADGFRRTVRYYE
jgi:nucleoside-diphosphate-sugar epimerase